MSHDCRAKQSCFSFARSTRPGRIVLASLLIISFLSASAGGVSASTPNPAPRPQAGLPAGTTLAVVRAGGASLYDDAGKLLLELPAGAAIKVSGRDAGNQWFYGSTADRTLGWVSAGNVLMFGVVNVPERQGFIPPVVENAASAGAAPVGTETAGAAKSQAAAAPQLKATVAGTEQRLNVRSGPGTTWPVMTSVAPGTVLVASARNAPGDWIRVEGAALPGASGWVSARYLALEGRAADLPVAAPAAAASARPRATAPATGLSGKLVFQESSGGKINVYDLGDGSLRTLTTGADPALSPDGRTVAFWRQSNTGHNLYLIDVGGANDPLNERLILQRTEKLRAPAWSPDGSKIVFSHVNGEHRCRDAGYGICMPDIFPYNLALPLKITDAWGLARVDREGGGWNDLAATQDAAAPDWSEHGIVYGGSGVHITQDAGDNQDRVVLGDQRYQSPAVQPGGDRIAFQSLEKDHWEIFTAGLDGSGVTALTRPATTLVTPLPHNVAPAWSPDGRHIVFLSNRTGQWQLWVMDVDGGNQHVLPLAAPIEYRNNIEQVVSWGK